MAVMISSSEKGEERSWSESVVSDELECGVITGWSSMGITSMSTWQFTTSWKCSAQWFNLSLSLCRVLPTFAIRMDEEGLENFFVKDASPLSIDTVQTPLLGIPVGKCTCNPPV